MICGLQLDWNICRFETLLKMEEIQYHNTLYTKTKNIWHFLK